MTVFELRRAASDLQARAVGGASVSLAAASVELDVLLLKASQVLPKATGFAEMTNKPLSWERVVKVTSTIILACDHAITDAPSDVPGDYGA